MDQDVQFARVIGTSTKKPGTPKAAIAILGFLVLFSLVNALVRPYTDWLWYRHDAGQPEVFLTAWRNRLMLFAIAFVPAWLLVFDAVRRPLRTAQVFSRTPDSIGERLVANALSWAEKRSGLAAALLATAFAGIEAFGFSAQWRAMALAQNAQPFGRTDPLFGMEVGWFVFVWPWLSALAAYVFGVFLTALVLSVALYAGLQALASLARIELGRPTIRKHLALLGALTLAALAWRTWLGRYGYGLADAGQFTGAGFAGSVQLKMQTVLAGVIALAALVTLVNGWKGKPFRATVMAVVASVLVFFVGLGLVPSIVQRAYVGPNYLDVEGPFAKNAIEMTRFAYGIDNIEVKDFDVQVRPTPVEVDASRNTLDNMRLWDPDVLRQSFEGLQGLRRYYAFYDVDIDRYTIDGKQRVVMLSPRDIDIDGLDRNARNWVNQRLQYTHGIGMALSPVNEAEPSGRPKFLVKDLPVKTPEGLSIEQPRLYFSDIRDEYGNLRDDYAVVDTKEDEFDMPSEREVKTYRWTANRGVPLGAPLAKFAYATLFSDQNLLISPNVTGKSRILYRRNVIERASLVYPFLQFDRDPYLVAFGGRFLWILDGYTTTDRVPYSARIRGAKGLNYIRNSVKAVVDAYSGECTAYAVEPEEPLLAAWQRVYPGLIRPASEIPEGLDRHFRYPEDLFMLQSHQLTQYHVTEPTQFLNNEDAWEVPVERGQSGSGERMKAYWVQMRLPDEADEGFMLILPFTPREKPNMSGWLAAHCDPGQYGRLVLYKFPKGSVIQGPAQMESIFDQDREIADINRQLNNDQSQIVPGNLLVVPIGRSVLYVKPLFLRSRSQGIQAIPELKKVILGLSDQVVVADTYAEALQKLFGRDPRKTGATPAPAAPSDAAQPAQESDAFIPKAQVRDAAKLLDQAQEALKAGDFGKYGELIRELSTKLRALGE